MLRLTDVKKKIMQYALISYRLQNAKLKGVCVYNYNISVPFEIWICQDSLGPFALFVFPCL